VLSLAVEPPDDTLSIMDFSPAAISFNDDDNPAAAPRQALLHNPSGTIAEAQARLAQADASDWPAYTIDGEDGVYVTPKGDIPVSEFATVLTAFGDEWLLVADPRTAATSGRS
jgi:hypothetical protein